MLLVSHNATQLISLVSFVVEVADTLHDFLYVGHR